MGRGIGIYAFAEMKSVKKWVLDGGHMEDTHGVRGYGLGNRG